jgi:hypothetical protein
MPPVPLRENSRAQERADPMSLIINYGSGFSSQSSPKHLQQCAESQTLRNSSLRPLAVTVLPVAFAGRRAATRCPAVQSTSPFTGRGAPAGVPAPGPRTAPAGCLQL